MNRYVLTLHWLPSHVAARLVELPESTEVGSRLEKALASAEHADLIGIRLALSQMVSGFPAVSYLRFKASEAPPSIPQDMIGIIAPGYASHITMIINENPMHTPAETTVSVDMPAIVFQNYQLEQLESEHKERLYLRLQISGKLKIDERTGIHRNLSFSATMDHFGRGFYNSIRPLLSSTSFVSLDQLVERITSRFIDDGELFNNTLDVKRINLRADVKAGLSPTAPTLRSASFSAVPAEGQQHVEPAADPSLAYGRDRIQRDGVFLAVGSNLGDRLQNLELACSEMDSDPDLRVIRTSALYETAPMYVEDQARFLNGVCEVCHLILKVPMYAGLIESRSKQI